MRRLICTVCGNQADLADWDRASSVETRSGGRATRWRNFVHLCLVRGRKDMPTGSCKDYKEMMTLTTRTRHTTYEIKYTGL
jgi:hypothetical protein